MKDRLYAEDVEGEREAWYELVELVRALRPEECLLAGYYRDPDWSVRDVVGHLGTWLAEAEVQFERMIAGSYDGHDIDVDAMNASFLAAFGDQPWDICWIQANAGRTRMLQAWGDLHKLTDEAAWWMRKSGAEHYGEHLPRLREWVVELVRHRYEEAGAAAT